MFLDSPTSNTNIQQQQKSLYLATGLFRKPRQPTKSYRPKQNQPYRFKNQSQSYMSNTGKDFPKRSSSIKQFPSSKPASSSTKFWKPTLSTTYLIMPRGSERKIDTLCGTMGRINSKQIGPRVSSIWKGFRIPFSSTPPFSTVRISLSQSSSLLLREEITELLQKWAMERVQDLGTPSVI